MSTDIKSLNFVIMVSIKLITNYKNLTQFWIIVICWQFEKVRVKRLSALKSISMLRHFITTYVPTNLFQSDLSVIDQLGLGWNLFFEEGLGHLSLPHHSLPSLVTAPVALLLSPPLESHFVLPVELL